MNYQKIYDSLIEKRKIFPLEKCGDGSIETHHIVPKCIGGNNRKSNKINLYAREHRFAHLLLYKIYKNTELQYKFLYAVIKMNFCNGKCQNRKESKSFIYQRLREEVSKMNIKEKSRYVKWNGKLYTIRELSEIRNIPYKQFRMLFYRNNHKNDINYIMSHDIEDKRHHFYNGQKVTTRELSKLSGISFSTIKKRMRKKYKEEDLTIYRPHIKREAEYNGKMYSMSELSKLSGIPMTHIRNRIFNMNWTVERAISTPVKHYKQRNIS